MCIEQISQTTVKLSLSEQDLKSLRISYDSIDYADADTREALLSLLKTVREETGFDASGAKLLVEAFRASKGITLFFTLLDAGKEESTATSSCPATPVVFGFHTLDSMVLGASKLFEKYGHRVYKSSLYRMPDSYHLMIYPLDASENTTIRFLSEYGPCIGEGEVYAAYLREHGRELLAQNAIDQISFYLS